jgi:hypothetical protein
VANVIGKSEDVPEKMYMPWAHREAFLECRMSPRLGMSTREARLRVYALKGNGDDLKMKTSRKRIMGLF